VKSSRAEIHCKLHKIPRLRFTQEGNLTAYAGLVLIQALIGMVGLKARLQRCFAHVGRTLIYGQSTIVLLVVVAIMLGCRRLRDLDYCREDPLLARVMGLRRLPDVATMSRTLAEVDEQGVVGLRTMVRTMVQERLEKEEFARITVDFDGSVQSTRGHAEGTAVGYNPVKKGERSYYPLFCTIAQTDQFFDVLARSGNVHDSSGASDFMLACLSELGRRHARAQLETRIDSAFYNELIFLTLEEHGVEFTCSVPFERFPVLKTKVETQAVWGAIDDQWSYAECEWKPSSWDARHRLLLVRQLKKTRQRGPLQLDLFVPTDYDYEYTVIATNKTMAPRAVLEFHHGRGSQEKLFGEAKQHVALDVVLGRRWIANQVFTLSGMVAHNLSREMQMAVQPTQRGTLAKRPARWIFLSLGTIRQRLLHRAGRLIRPQGELTLELNANPSVQADFTRYLDTMTSGP
jgi:hypothetical protein